MPKKTETEAAAAPEAAPKPADAWPPRQHSMLDSPAVQAAAKEGAARAADAAAKSKEAAKRFIDAFLDDLPERAAAGIYTVGPDDPWWKRRYDEVQDGWYSDRQWKLHFQEGRFTEARRADHANQPSAHTPV